MTYCESAESDLTKIAKAWSTAMKFAKERLKRVYDLKNDQLEEAANEGQVILETLCLFIHACIKPGQFKPPLEFWRILHAEYGIVVYPSAFTDEIVAQGLDMDVAWSEIYYGHIMMFPRCCDSTQPPRCPFEYLQEPPPVYEK